MHYTTRFLQIVFLWLVVMGSAFTEQAAAARLSKASQYSVFALNAGKVTIRFQADVPVRDVKASIGGYPIVDASISGNAIACSFESGLLMPGKYDLELACVFQDGKSENLVTAIEIAPALRPRENFQVNAWGDRHELYPSYGITMYAAGKSGSEPPQPEVIDEGTRRGVYSTFNFHYFGTPRPDHPEDSAIDYDGKKSYPNPRSEYIQADVQKKIRQVIASIQDAPSFAGIVINTEHHTGGTGYKAFDFSPHELERAKSFGLDLNIWRKKGSASPMGNLYLSMAPKSLVPEDRVIPEDNPLYAYHMDRHGPNGGTEVIPNENIARALLDARPDLLAIQDPILRRPVIYAYRNINVAADWTYYMNPTSIITMRERLGAVVRSNPNMSPCVMPQFLFKRGTAAPYTGLPTADLFREACYLAISRPSRIATFWNAKAALCPSPEKARYAWDVGKTPEEMDEIFGGKSEEEILNILEETKMKVCCIDPRLKTEFKSFSDNIWIPFGALFPNWQNAPRRVALVRSFAADLYSNQDWPGYNIPLIPALCELGVPYDVLFDEDLTGDLSRYDMILLPYAFALPKKGIENLLAFQKQGGVIVADEKLHVAPLKPVSHILKQAQGKDFDLKAETAKLLEQCGGKMDSIGYIEGIQMLQEKAAALSGFPELAHLVQQVVKTDFRSASKDVLWNHLQADEANYLVAVNNLRIPGPIYGRFGKVSETGLPQTVEFNLFNDQLRFAYDLTARHPLEINNNTIRLPLDPCSGKIILFTPKKLGDLSVTGTNVRCGEKVTVAVRIENGCGLIPVILELFDAQGNKSSLSRSDVLKNGVLSREWTIPLNAPVGTWKVRVQELARGMSKEATFKVQ